MRAIDRIDGRSAIYEGNIKEFAAFLIPDKTHCPGNCTKGQG